MCRMSSHICVKFYNALRILLECVFLSVLKTTHLWLKINYASEIGKQQINLK